LDYSDFEIIILPDESFIKFIPHAPGIPYKIIPTGPVTPASKRDMALEYAKGEILAFIDDDAYPHKDWLKNALGNFQDINVAAVGGPAITPLEDNLRQVASGAVYSSALVSGNYTYRYVPGEKIEVDDYPSCNLLVRKTVMRELGGFNTAFWPGEDTKLCLDITKKLGKKIIYDPTVLVYHHRRPLFSAHLKQIASYATHRGYFVKRYPQTSLRLPYFIPTIFLLGVILGLVLTTQSIFFRVVYILGMLAYLMLVFIFALVGTLKENTRNFTFSQQATLLTDIFAGIILTHFYYGFYFLKGLVLPKLKEEA